MPLFASFSLSPSSSQALLLLSVFLDSRRSAILENWRELVIQDDQLQTSENLTRVQLLDHLPEFLRAFTQNLSDLASEVAEDVAAIDVQSNDDESSTRSSPIGVVGDLQTSAEAESVEMEKARDHGVHRWQQGYNVWEVTREFTHLQVCVAREITVYAQENPDFTTGAMSVAHESLAALISRGVEESVKQFTQGREAEARSRVQHLEQVLRELSDLERVRGESMRAASHDMRGSLAVVEGAASMLINVGDDPMRDDLTGIVQRSVESLQRMVSDFMNLSRLEAGQEILHFEDFDVSDILTPLCENSQPLAANFGLWLRCEGEALIVEGDGAKVLRIAQNLLINALKYTPEGGVQVSWRALGEDEWVLHVADTGLGIDATQWPLTEIIADATDAAREVDDDSKPATILPTAVAIDTSTTTPAAISASTPSASTISASTISASERLMPGEGIGLTIVKRLCEMMDARLEVDSQENRGTTFTVVFPRRYARDL